jgi:uroporphyrinogen-III synthase
VLDADHVIFVSGNTYQILNTKTMEKKIYFSHSGGGVGAVCVHPTKKYFAVGEKGLYPCIFIYGYPEM